MFVTDTDRAYVSVLSGNCSEDLHFYLNLIRWDTYLV